MTVTPVNNRSGPGVPAVGQHEPGSGPDAI
jgi:hypothetical protein